MCVGCGFAAGCEVGLCPTGGNLWNLGYAPGMGYAPTNDGQSPNQGHSPISNFSVNGGAEPRLTSGGKAAAEMQEN
jgi:hypothetical protein